MKICLCLISTKKYDQFVQPLIDSVKKYFLVDHDIEVHLFTDKMDNNYVGDYRVSILKHKIDSYGWPEATMYRYKIMTSITYNSHYLYYLDVDYLIVDFVGNEFLAPLVAVQHPGFYISGGGSWENRPISMQYVSKDRQKKYLAGGTQGGALSVYYVAMIQMENFIQHDINNGIIPVWHDESAWNAYCTLFWGRLTILDPSYCMVEEISKRKAWGIDTIPPKIIALSKNHSKIRS